MPTLTVPKSDSLPVFLPPPADEEEEEEDEEEDEEEEEMRIVEVSGVFLASCAGIDGTLEKAVDGTNPESMFQ